MALLLWLFMALVPFVVGKSALRVLYGNQPTQEFDLADCILTGGIIVIGLAEGAHLGAVILGRSFSDCVKMFGVGIVICFLVALGIQMLCKRKCLRKKAQKGDTVRKMQSVEKKGIVIAPATGMQKMVYILFGIIVIIQGISIVTMQRVYLDGDMTLETVNSFLATDGIYQVNPMTGKAYTLGIPMRLKILCLPTFYAILCESFRLDAGAVVLQNIPLFVLLGSYLACSTVAKKFFGENAVRRGIFLVLTALLFVAGDYMFGMDGFGVMHSGFRGVTIRAAILVPYTLGLMLRKKYKLVLLCILVEACVVWTFYGLGACVAVAAGVLCIRFAMELLAKHKGRKGDKYAGTPE